MRVVLLENISSLGNRGDIKDVSDGYAVNFLLPNNKVALATADNVNLLKAKANKIAAQAEAQQDNYNKVSKTLNKQSLNFSAKVSDKNVLFKGISGQDILVEIKNKFNLDINEKWFVKSVLLKEVGRHNIYLRLPNNQLISFFINIKAI